MGFFDGQMNFTDPNTLALLGATGALGEAAMPSRLPIPTGAMLAKAAGGLAAGSNAYKNQLEQAQTRLANSQAAMSAASIDAVKRQLQMMGQMPGSENPASPAGPTPTQNAPANVVAPAGVSNNETSGTGLTTGAPLAAGSGGVDPSQVYGYLTNDLKATPNEAALLTSAAGAESGFDPTKTHDGGIGYGMFGHNGDRLAAMQQQAGTPTPGWQDQLKFSLDELRNRPEGAQVNDAKTPEQLTDLQMKFEQPNRKINNGNYDQRLAFTRQILAAPPGQNQQFAQASPQTVTDASPAVASPGGAPGSLPPHIGLSGNGPSAQLVNQDTGAPIASTGGLQTAAGATNSPTPSAPLGGPVLPPVGPAAAGAAGLSGNPTSLRDALTRVLSGAPSAGAGPGLAAAPAPSPALASAATPPPVIANPAAVAAMPQPMPGNRISPAQVQWAKQYSALGEITKIQAPKWVQDMAEMGPGMPLSPEYKAGIAAAEAWAKNPAAIAAEYAKQGLQLGANGQLQPIPGYATSAAANQATIKGSVKAAEAPYTALRPGSMLPGTNAIASGGPVINTGEAGERGHKLADIGISIRDDATAARTQNYMLDNMLASSKGFKPGAGADETAFLKSLVNAVLPNAFTESLPSYQEFQKLAIQNARETTRSMGAGEAATVFQTNIQANPNAKLTRQGLESIIGSMHALNDYKIARDQAAADWRGSHGSMDGFDNSPWVASNPIGKFRLPYMTPQELMQMRQSLAGRQ